MGIPSSSTPPTSSNNIETESINLETKIIPTILLIIVIFSIFLFILGLLHLIVRSLLRPTQREQDELDHATVLQGQLQQLFQLHDSGVDQSYIDTLPVFYYKAIIGLKDPFDCAVCLCEFEPNDSLRLLPKCSHAFHMECIDTWLLSHSTCPLCRSSLLLDYGVGNHGCSSIVCVLDQSASVENSREIGGVGFDRERNSVSGSNPLVGCQDEDEFGLGQVGFPRKSCDDGVIMESCEKHEERIVVIKLGKFKSVDVGEGSSANDNTNTNGNNIDNNMNISNNNYNNKNISGGNDDLGSRRCYSMGSFAYVLDETTSLKVPIKNTPIKKQYSKKPNLPLRSGYRAAISEYGCDSKRDFNIDNIRAIENGNRNGNEQSKRRESFSLSKIWARGGGREINKKANGYEKSKRSNSELLEIEVSELGDDEETQSCYSVDSLAHSTTSTSTNTRRTLLWLMGRQNKTVHNHSKSLSSNV